MTAIESNESDSKQMTAMSNGDVKCRCDMVVLGRNGTRCRGSECAVEDAIGMTMSRYLGDSVTQGAKCGS